MTTTAAQTARLEFILAQRERESTPRPGTEPTHTTHPPPPPFPGHPRSILQQSHVIFPPPSPTEEQGF
ncbi:uncharacterized protein ACO6RY_12456 [Pungitius sinensis]